MEGIEMISVTIDGPTVAKDDGTEVCLGYYEDADGRVVSRFSVPSGEYEVPNAVESVVYVNLTDDLPPINSHYKSELDE